MNEPTLPSSALPFSAPPVPGIADAGNAALPLYWEYVAAAYAVVAIAMLWLVLAAWRERLRLRRMAQLQGKR